MGVGEEGETGQAHLLGRKDSHQKNTKLASPSINLTVAQQFTYLIYLNFYKLGALIFLIQQMKKLCPRPKNQ